MYFCRSVNKLKGGEKQDTQKKGKTQEMNKDIKLTDKELLKRIGEKDSEAFEEFHKRHHKEVWTAFYTLTHDIERCNDLSQDFWMYIYENAKKLNMENDNASAFLHTIVIRNVAGKLKKSFTQIMNIDDNKQATELKDNSPSATDMLALEELKKVLKEIVETLPELQQKVFWMRKIDGRAVKDIAKELNLTPGTVSNALSMATKTVKAQLSGAGIARELLSVLLF